MQNDTSLNKSYRGQIMRIVARFYPTPITVKQIKLGLTEYGINYQSDVDKHLFYLEDKEYVYIDNKDRKDDCTVKITAKGIDLVEATITDNGILM